jgi:hypothetical protein
MATATLSPLSQPPWILEHPHDRAKVYFSAFYLSAKKLTCLTGKEVYVLNEGKIWNKLGHQSEPLWEFLKFKPESVEAIKEVFITCYNYVAALQEAEGSDFLYTFYSPGGMHDTITETITEFLPPIEVPRSRSPPINTQ